MRGICIPNESLYSDKDIQELILKKFNGILFAGGQEGFYFWLGNRNVLKHSLTLNGEFKNQYKDLTPYIDEPISTPTIHSKIWNMIRTIYIDTIIGELQKFNLLNSFITYTAYRDVLFTIFGLRVYKFWGNQIKTWDKLHKQFGGKFPMVWIHLTDNEKDFAELTSWATTYNKAIWFYAPIGITKEQLINQINKL